MARKPAGSTPITRAVSRRSVLRAGGILVPAALVAPSFFARVARAASAPLFDFYISTSGSDQNPGTVSQPWAITSLQDTNGNNGKMAGKRVGLIAGTYNIANMRSGSQPGDYQHPVLRVPTGSASAPSYVGSSDSSGNYSRGAAVLVYGTSAGVNPMIGQNPGDRGYWTLDGVELNGNGYAGPLINLGYTTGGYTSGGTVPGVIVRNCHLHGITGSPVGNNEALIFNAGTSGAIITNNVMHDAHKPAQPDHCHAYLEYGCQGTQITFNTIYNCDTGVHAKAGCSGTVVANNYFYNCPTCAVQGMDGAEGNPNTPGTPYSVHHNVIDSCGASHQCDINGQAYQGLNWYNNTIYNTQTGSVAALDLRAGSSSLIKSYNNLVVCTANGTGQYMGTVALSSGGYSVLDYNCYHFNSFGQAFGLSGSSTYGSLSAWQSASRAETHSMTGSPSFASSIQAGAGAAQFKLASGSPCAGAGRVGGSSSGAACNIGAWDGTVTQIGASTTGTAPPAVVPDAPNLTVS